MTFVIISVLSLGILLGAISFKYAILKAVDDGLDVREKCETLASRANRLRQEKIHTIAQLSIAIYILVLIVLI